MFRRRVAAAAPEPVDPIRAALAAETAARTATTTQLWPTIRVTRDQALQLSVINRARDLFAGVASTLPFTRTTTFGVDPGAPPRPLPVGWLEQPDPQRTRGALVASLIDDLFFYGWAALRVTARSFDGFPSAVKHYPWTQLAPPRGHPSRTDGGGLVDRWTYTPPAGPAQTFSALHVVTFESPLVGVLCSGVVLDVAARLSAASRRFASASVPMGWLEQKAGSEPLDPSELAELADGFAAARELNAIAALNEAVSYHESTMDPDRLQLIEARAYQDAALARVANVPGFMVGAATPGDSMTYKTALAARFDLLDFGLAPFLACLCQTLSLGDVTPRGQIIGMDPSPFLRTTDLAGVDTTPAPTPTGVAA